MPERPALLSEIEREAAVSPTLWWLGHAGFVLKFRKAILYVDPLLSEAPGRLTEAPFRGEDAVHAGLVLVTHDNPAHLDPTTVRGILGASPHAKLVIPKALGERAHALGIGFDRMVTTNADLRVEYLDDRIYAVPSANPDLGWTAIGGYPSLGYLIRFGSCTVYHAGSCVPYDTLAKRLKPYNVTVALLPISGPPQNFDIAEAAQLAEDIGAEWLVPMHYGMFERETADVNRFVDHLLGHRPAQKFKVFECGEKWIMP